MNEESQQPGRHGVALLTAPCQSPDPGTPTARERLDAALGPELARVLVFALASGTHARVPLVRSV